MSTQLFPDTIASIYGHRLRVRVSGLVRDGDSLLLVCHRGLGEAGIYWAPPGGGVNYGETVAEALRREVAEETGLLIESGRFLGVYEHLAPPLHAIELCFATYLVGGLLRMGADPEMAGGEQLIIAVQFMPFSQIAELPSAQKHAMFHGCLSIESIFAQSAYLTNR